VCGYSCKGVLTEFEGSHHRESALKSVVWRLISLFTIVGSLPYTTFKVFSKIKTY
jgi:hypothetical protein